jgi:hypothetical protein
MSNKRQNVLIQILAFMFTVIGAVSLYNAIIDSDLKRALTSFGIMCFAGFIGWYMGKSDKDKKEPDAFLIQLQENSETISNGGWMYGENLITPQTIITQYFFTVSLVTVSFKVPSRFYIVGEENTAFVNSIYTLFSFLLGWWAIPKGPFYTISTLTNNIKGGNKLNVGELIGA